MMASALPLPGLHQHRFLSDRARLGATAMAEHETLSWRERSPRIVVSSLQEGELQIRVQVEGEMPSWLAPTLQTIVELLNLPENWNSYGAPTVEPSAIAWALDLLGRTMRPDTP